MPTELHCLLVSGINYWQGTIVKCGILAMAGSVTEAQSHDEDTCVYRGGKNVTRVQGRVTRIQNKSTTGDMEKGVGIEV